MGLARLAEIADGLVAAGLDPQTPAAVISGGTTSGQETVVATVATVAARGRRLPAAGADRRRRRGLAFRASRERSWNTRSCVKIVCLPGDGIGVEVTAAAREVLAVLAPDLELEDHPFGGAAILATGTPFPDETLAACRQADAVLLGAVGLPQFDAADVRPEQGLIALRKALDVYANLRPSRQGPVDLMVVRELVGGLYYGAEGHPRRRNGVRHARVPPEPGRAHRPPRVRDRPQAAAPGHLVDKANVLETSRMWRRVVIEVAAQYPGR